MFDSDTLALIAQEDAPRDGEAVHAAQRAADQQGDAGSDGEQGEASADLSEDAVADFDSPRLDFINVPMHDDIDEWLLQECRPHVTDEGRTIAKVHVLAFTEQEEVCLMMPAYKVEGRLIGCDAVRDPDLQQQDARLNPFSMLRIRRIDCSDGSELCCVCYNPGCPRSRQHHDELEDEMLHPQQFHRTRQQVFGDRQPLCRCARAALEAEFGSVGDPNANEDSQTFCSWLLQQDPISAQSARMPDYEKPCQAL